MAVVCGDGKRYMNLQLGGAQHKFAVCTTRPCQRYSNACQPAAAVHDVQLCNSGWQWSLCDEACYHRGQLLQGATAPLRGRQTAAPASRPARQMECQLEQLTFACPAAFVPQCASLQKPAKRFTHVIWGSCSQRLATLAAALPAPATRLQHRPNCLVITFAASSRFGFPPLWHCELISAPPTLRVQAKPRCAGRAGSILSSWLPLAGPPSGPALLQCDQQALHWLLHIAPALRHTRCPCHRCCRSRRFR